MSSLWASSSWASLLWASLHVGEFTGTHSLPRVETLTLVWPGHTVSSALCDSHVLLNSLNFFNFSFVVPMGVELSLSFCLKLQLVN